MVPLTGLEPVRYCYRGILSPLRLPIPPQRRIKYNILNAPFCQVKTLYKYNFNRYFASKPAQSV